RLLLPFLALGAMLAGCDLHDLKPFDENSVIRPYRIAAAANHTPDHRPMDTKLDDEFLKPRTGPIDQNRPKPLESYTQGMGPVIRMSLKDLIQLAAANSLQVRVANYQAAIDEARVVEAEARFDPTIFSDINFATQFSLTPTPQNTSATPTARQFF